MIHIGSQRSLHRIHGSLSPRCKNMRRLFSLKDHHMMSHAAQIVSGGQPGHGDLFDGDPSLAVSGGRDEKDLRMPSDIRPQPVHYLCGRNAVRFIRHTADTVGAAAAACQAHGLCQRMIVHQKALGL